MRDRKKGHSCPAHRERGGGGKKQATVAWHSPGLGLGIYIESKMMRQHVLSKETKGWQEGKQKEWGSASDKPRSVIHKEGSSEQREK